MATRRRGGAGCAPSLHRWLALAVLVLALLCGVAQAAKDYYKIMGVDTGADDRTIKRAYRVGIRCPFLLALAMAKVADWTMKT